MREKADELKEKATDRADEITSRAGARVTTIARALRRAGEELRGEGDERLASMTDDFAGQIERVGSYLHGESPGRMVEDLERMAKGNPALFVGGTFAAGLLFGRFLRSDEPKADVDIEFQPDGDWTDDAESVKNGAEPDMGVIDEGPDDGPGPVGGER